MNELSREELLRLFASVGPFSSGPDGLAPARERSKDGERGKCVYIRRDATVAFTRQFLSARPFCEGVAVAQEDDGKWVYILPDGKNAFKRQGNSASDFEDGVSILEEEDGSFVYILINGGNGNKERYLVAGKFICGRARVAQMQGGKRVEFHIRRQDFQPTCKETHDLVDPYIARAKVCDNGHWSSVDLDGKKVPAE